MYTTQMRQQITVWQTSTTLWEHASSLQPASTELLGNLAQAYSLALRPNKAIRTYQKAIAMHSEGSAELHHMFGQALRKSAQTKPETKHKHLAKEHYEKAIQLDALQSETLAALAWWHEEFNPSEESSKISLEYYKQAEDVAHYGLTQEGRKKRGLTNSKTVPLKVLNDPVFWLSYGMCIDRLIKSDATSKTLTHATHFGDGFESKTKYEEAIKMDSTLSEAYYRLGKVVAPASVKQAHRYYALAIAHNADFVDALYAQANLYHKQGGSENEDKSIALYLKAIELEPGATDLRINCALSYRSAKKTDQALEMARSVLAIDSFHRKASALVDELTAF